MRHHKEILRLALPNILSNISVPLLGTVDTALMGHLSPLHLGAVGISSMIFNFIYWNFGFLRMGTTGMTAQAYGADRQEEITASLGRGLVVGIVLAILIFALQVPLLGIASYVLQVQDSHIALVDQYFKIRVIDVPASLCLFVLMGWFFGMQNAMIPLILTLTINIINILLSAYLVRVQGMGIDGVAWGTVVSQYVGLWVGVILLLWKYPQYVKEINLKVLSEWQGIKGYLKVNTDLFIRTMCLTLGFAFFYSMSSSGGAMVLAVNVIMMQFVNWMSYAIDGYAYAAESLVGKYKGRRSQADFDAVVKASFVWAGGFAVVILIIYTLGGSTLLQIFSSEIDVIAEAEQYLWWMAVMPLVAFFSYIWDGIYIGLMESRHMRNAMLLSLLMYLASYFLFEKILDPVNAIWAALICFLGIRALWQWYLYKRYGLGEV